MNGEAEQAENKRKNFSKNRPQVLINLKIQYYSLKK